MRLDIDGDKELLDKKMVKFTLEMYNVYLMPDDTYKEITDNQVARRMVRFLNSHWDKFNTADIAVTNFPEHFKQITYLDKHFPCHIKFHNGRHFHCDKDKYDYYVPKEKSKEVTATPSDLVDEQQTNTTNTEEKSSLAPMETDKTKDIDNEAQKMSGQDNTNNETNSSDNDNGRPANTHKGKGKQKGSGCCMVQVTLNYTSN